MIKAIHSQYVVDASVAAKWFTHHEEPDPKHHTDLHNTQYFQQV